MQARARQATSTGGANPQLRANWPEAEEGRARDAIAEVAGVSGRTIDKVKTIRAAAITEVQDMARIYRKVATIVILPLRKICRNGIQHPNKS